MNDKPRWRLVTRVNQSVSVFEGSLIECRNRRNDGNAYAGRVRCSMVRIHEPLPEWAIDVIEDFCIVETRINVKFEQ